MNSNSPLAPFAVDILTAAKLVGHSRSQFYKLYIGPGRVKPLKTGGRDRVIDVAELKAAYEALRAELRSSPSELTEAGV